MRRGSVLKSVCTSHVGKTPLGRIGPSSVFLISGGVAVILAVMIHDAQFSLLRLGTARPHSIARGGDGSHWTRPI